MEKDITRLSGDDVQFFALDSTYMDPAQLDWLDKELSNLSAGWKMCFFHHPLHSNDRMHGADVDLRAQLEPIFKKRGVAPVFSGHDHVYERLKPQNGIYYTVLGSSGQLREHDPKPSPDTAKGFDTDRTFEMVEIAGDEIYFQTVSRSGQAIDSGVLKRQPAQVASSAAASAAP